MPILRQARRNLVRGASHTWKQPRQAKVRKQCNGESGDDHSIILCRATREAKTSTRTPAKVMPRKTLCMAPHLPFIAPPATLLAAGTGSSNDPFSHRHLLRFGSTTNPFRQIVRIGALASWTRQLRAGAVSPSRSTCSPSGASSAVVGISVGAIAVSPQRRSWTVASSPFFEPGLRGVGSQRFEACHQFFLRLPQPLLQAVQQRQFSDCRWSRGLVVPRGFDSRL